MKLEPISDEQLIESLRQDILDQADQIGGLTSEMEQLRDVYTATAELLQIREEQVQQLLKDVSDSQQQLAVSQAEVVALTSELEREKRDRERLIRFAESQDRSVTLLMSQRDKLFQQIAALRQALVAYEQKYGKAILEMPCPQCLADSYEGCQKGCISLNARTALATPSAAAEGDGSIFDLPKPGRRSHGKVVSVTDRPPLVIEGEPSAAAERVQARDATIRECLEGIIENRIADGGVCVRRVADCDCSECLARAALAALDAAKGLADV